MSTSRKKVMKKLFKMLGIKTKGALSCDDYKKIIDSTIAWLDMEMDVSVTIADVKRGRGYCEEKKMILPLWLNECDTAYQVYYAIHELTHCLLGYRHDKSYKKVEDVLLGLWGIQIVRKKVYPKRLFLDGKEIFYFKNDSPNSYEAEDMAAGQCGSKGGCANER